MLGVVPFLEWNKELLCLAAAYPFIDSPVSVISTSRMKIIRDSIVCIYKERPESPFFKSSRTDTTRLIKSAMFLTISDEGHKRREMKSFSHENIEL
jgi:hypothetical protein